MHDPSDIDPRRGDAVPPGVVSRRSELARAAVGAWMVCPKGDVDPPGPTVDFDLIAYEYLEFHACLYLMHRSEVLGRIEGTLEVVGLASGAPAPGAIAVE